MSIQKDLFTHLIRHLTEPLVQLSVRFFLARQRDHSFRANGIRIIDSGFRQPQSLLCRTILQRYEVWDPVVLNWLNLLTSFVLKFDYKKFNYDPFRTTPEQTCELIRDAVEKNAGKNKRPKETVAALCACVLEDAVVEILKIPVDQRSPEKMDAAYDKLSALYESAVPGIHLPRRRPAAEPKKSTEASAVGSSDADRKEDRSDKKAAAAGAGVASHAENRIESGDVLARPQERSLVGDVAAAALETSGGTDVRTNVDAQKGIQGASAPLGEQSQRPASSRAQKTPDNSTSGNALKKAPPSPNLAEASANYLEAPEKVFSVKNEYELPPLPEDGRRRYLGCIRSAGTFRNFFPAAEYEYGDWMPIELERARSIWPRFGGFNLYSVRRQNYPEGPVYIADAGERDYAVAAEHASGEQRVDFVKRADAEVMRREHRLRPAAEFGGFPIVYPTELPIDTAGRIDVRFDPLPPSGKESEADRRRSAEAVSVLGSFLRGSSVLLLVEDRLYGPLKLVEDGFGRPYVLIKTESESGLAKGFLFDPLTGPRMLRLRGSERSAEGEEKTAEFDFVFVGELDAAVFDILDDAAILSKLAAAVNASKSEREAVVEWMRAAVTRRDFFSDDFRIARSRAKRIEIALSRDMGVDLIARNASMLLAKLVARDETIFEQAVRFIASDPKMLDRILPYAEIANAIKDAEKRLEEARRAESSFEAGVEARRKSFRRQLEQENSVLLKKNDELEEKISSHKSVLGAIAESADSIEFLQRLNAEIDARKATLENYRREVAGLDDYLHSAVSNAGRHVFDGMIASKLQRAAAEWERGEDKRHYAARAQAVRSVPRSTLAGTALADHLVNTFRKTRPYDRNTVLGIFISIAQSFLTIFAGEPGTGKTSAAGIAAHALGLGAAGSEGAAPERANAEVLERFVAVSVERGWTSKRDFLGFYNSLSERFESPDYRRTDAFRQLDEEARLGFDGIPYLMLLDEANLSPMEFYWADFMNVADACRTGASSAFISLGDGTRCAVPDTLRFIATINSDFTTESLSPRLIDRAAVLTLPTPSIATLAKPEAPLDWRVREPVVDWQRFLDVFDKPNTPSASVLGKLDEACACYAGIGRPASPRTMRAMLRFAATAAALFESKDGLTAEQQALDRAVAQKLLPQINGSGEGCRRALEALLACSERNGWRMSAEHLAAMLARGAENMDDYAFF